MPRSDTKIGNGLVQLKRMGNTFGIKGLKNQLAIFVEMTKVHAYPLVLICNCKQVPLKQKCFIAFSNYTGNF